MIGDETERRGENEGVSGRLNRALTINGEHFDRFFALVQFLFFGVLLAMTPQYGSDSRLFPLVIGVPTFLLFGVLLLTQFSSRFADLVGSLATSDMFGFEDQFGEQRAGEPAAETRLARRRRLAKISLWMLALFGLVFLVGFLPATVLFLVGFYRFYAECGWVRSIGYTVVFTVFVVLIFDVVMGTPFYQGVLGIEIPL